MCAQPDVTVLLHGPERPPLPPGPRPGCGRLRGARWGRVRDPVPAPVTRRRSRQGWGIPVPASGRPLASSRAGVDLRKAALSVLPEMNGGGEARELQVLRVLGQGSASPASSARSRCHGPSRPRIPLLPPYPGCPFDPGPGVTGSSPDGRLREGDGASELEEGDGLRAGGGDRGFLGGCPCSLQPSWGFPGFLPGFGGSIGCRGGGRGQPPLNPRGLPAPLGSAERR